jgi:hypothetical protein
MSEKKTKESEVSTTAKEVADVVRDNYAKALESATKLQEQYFENAKKATDYLLSLQKTWIDSASKMTTASPDFLKSGVTSEAYRSIYDFWMRQFETLSRVSGMPIVTPFRESVEAAKDVTDSYWKGYEIYSKSYAVWIELAKKNIEITSQNLAEMQKAMLGTYKGMMPLFSISEEDKTKYFDWIAASTQKSLEVSTAVVNKQLETLAKLVEDLSANVDKLAAVMKASMTSK